LVLTGGDHGDDADAPPELGRLAIRVQAEAYLPTELRRDHRRASMF
jgi:hypothetical protein